MDGGQWSSESRKGYNLRDAVNRCTVQVFALEHLPEVASSFFANKSVNFSLPESIPLIGAWSKFLAPLSKDGFNRLRLDATNEWAAEEDSLLRKLVKQHGVRKWSQIARKLVCMIWKQCRERSFLRARATGKAVLTNPFRLLESNHLGVVLTFPVYRSGLPADATVDDRVEATAGYLGGAFDVELLVDNLLRQLAGSQREQERYRSLLMT
ncbi:hypothetical protein J5N97_013840 [Dioscorea zingiberensis]|uniref:Myb-like domain-containing protein n=1 Tax=Dioscorea zingiberensis TaxID=325984 RepID=A0A9D5CR91_9LILI|nr:hypothetical protein J5N97_013840 [Dioscorea zingiberensis]